MADAWRAWNFEQRMAAVGAVLLVVSTFGPFSFVEVAEVLVAAGVLWLLWARAQRKEFHLPFGDGTVIMAAGLWAGLLIAVRLFDRALGLNLLALACAGILVVAGLLERAKRPPDDLPAPPERERAHGWEPPPPPATPPGREAAKVPRPGEQMALRDPVTPDVPEPEAPPEFEPTRRIPADEEPTEHLRQERSEES
jgi:hypothetical protein